MTSEQPQSAAARDLVDRARADLGGVEGAIREDRFLALLEFFANPPPDFEERSLAVLTAGLAAGEDPDGALRATRLLQAYELSFWDAIADGLG